MVINNMIIIWRKVHVGNDRHVKTSLLNIVAAAISLAVEHVLLRDNTYVKPEPAFIIVKQKTMQSTKAACCNTDKGHDDDWGQAKVSTSQRQQKATTSFCEPAIHASLGLQQSENLFTPSVYLWSQHDCQMQSLL